ncbi:Cof-type HAD-IIB family hydrolase [Cohnella faecalis]|uniref:HAD family phosphatase n=1 Tax=Cohnella faecalis TaxID=2315694 RepID=A0A398CQX7_9BACL|nr:Cof-type HAD-IIB family hydrolase [Cohnella faecalis]RIE03198.1 HAD family phosphatase [Cohnella faecalis]
MTQYRLLAIDLDGTLLNEAGEISAMNHEWVKKATDAGITVCVSTGRGFKSALPIAEQLGLQTPMITVNGGEIWSKPHTLHQRTLLDSDKVAKLHALAKRYPETWFWAYSIEDIYNKERWIDNDPEAHEWLKFGYYTEDKNALDGILAEIRTWDGLELSNSSPFNIEVNPSGVSKATAVEEVCRLLGIELSQAVAVGDSLNDIAAIRACGLGVAMGNAQDEVKASADIVTSSNLEDGVAHLIQNYLLKA